MHLVITRLFFTSVLILIGPLRLGLLVILKSKYDQLMYADCFLTSEAFVEPKSTFATGNPPHGPEYHASNFQRKL
jgi:hypothetical protein